MSQNGKWLENVAPDADVADVTRKALGERLEAVVQWLPAAAYCADLDVEYIHRLRVSTRRATAAWRLFQLWLPPKRAERIKIWLKEIRQAAGEARDLDVLRARLEKELEGDAHGVLDKVARRRERVQPKIARIADRARKNRRLQRDIKKLLDGIEQCCNKRSCDECAPYQKWARRQLAKLAEEFFADLPKTEDPVALHQFRIRAKALRYAIELLASAFGEELREKHYPVVEELQERLGSINDHATASTRLAEWSRKESVPALKSKFQELAERESRGLGEELQEFRAWWTDDRVESLRCGLTSAETKCDRTVLAY